MSLANDDLKRFIDETGLLMEAGGLPRSAGLVLGFMLVCEPEQQSMTDMTAALGISKATASAMTRMLMHIGFLERSVGPVDRRDYYRVSPKAWERFFRTRIETMHRMRANAERGLQILQHASPLRRERLERMQRLSSFLERGLGGLLAQFESDECERMARNPAEAVAP